VFENFTLPPDMAANQLTLKVLGVSEAQVLAAAIS